jgi:LPXTG-motif cell wall-anchored protein
VTVYGPTQSTYYLKETTAPSSYTADTTVYTVTVSSDYKTTTDGQGNTVNLTRDVETDSGTETGLVKEATLSYVDGQGQTQNVASTTTPATTDADGNTATLYQFHNEPAIDVTILKADEEADASGNTVYLADASFDVSRQSVDGTGYNYTDYDYNTADDVAGSSNVIISTADDTGVTMHQVGSGTYRLQETAAPTGYVVMTNNLFFEMDGTTLTLVNEDGSAYQGDQASVVTNTDATTGEVEGYTITITNTKGASLPSTGGSGSTAFTLLGSMLVALSLAMLLIRWHRRNALAGIHPRRRGQEGGHRFE